eukprot:ctg_2402.g758
MEHFRPVRRGVVYDGVGGVGRRRLRPASAAPALAGGLHHGAERRVVRPRCAALQEPIGGVGGEEEGMRWACAWSDRLLLLCLHDAPVASFDGHR